LTGCGHLSETAVADETAAAMIAESVEADVTDGTGGGSGRDDDGGIVVGMLVCK
jgi:hypothetical protein